MAGNPFEKLTFAKLPDEVRSDPGLADGAKVLFAELMSQFRTKQHELYGVAVCDAELARNVGRSTKTVARRRRQLIAAGLVVVTGGSGGGPNGIRMYQLCRPEVSTIPGVVDKVGRTTVSQPKSGGQSWPDTMSHERCTTVHTPGAAKPVHHSGRIDARVCDFVPIEERKDLIRSFYQRLGHDPVSSRLVNTGLPVLNRMLDDGLTMEQCRAAATWTVVHVAGVHSFGMVERQSGRAVAEAQTGRNDRDADRGMDAATAAARFHDGDPVRLGRKVGVVEGEFVRFANGVASLASLAGKLQKEDE